VKNLLKINLIICLFFGLISCNNNQKNEEKEEGSTGGIEFFQGNFKAAKAKAKAENKLIFMDAYASWCGPCKMMQRNTFPDPLVGKLFNEKFVSVAYDMEIGEGLELAAQYPVSAYPTLFFMDADGNVISSELGYRDPAGLVTLGQSITKN
jgi:thioredoxin 1